MRRLLCVLAVVALAGCLTGPAGTPTDVTDRSPTDAPSLTDSPTPTVSPTPATGTESTPTDANTVDYAALSSESQAAFDAAIDGEARFLPDSEYVESEYRDPDALDPFRDHEFVSRNGTTYDLSSHQGDLYASYTIYADPASPGENASVVAYENLSANVSTEVRRAVENGSYHAPLGKWDSLPEELGNASYVRYEGETYETSYAVGDYWVEVLTAEPVV